MICDHIYCIFQALICLIPIVNNLHFSIKFNVVRDFHSCVYKETAEKGCRSQFETAMETIAMEKAAIVNECGGKLSN